MKRIKKENLMLKKKKKIKPDKIKNQNLNFLLKKKYKLKTIGKKTNKKIGL